jgi:hypothetical protein
LSKAMHNIVIVIGWIVPAASSTWPDAVDLLQF